MRASYKWLKELCRFDETPEQVAERLTSAGLEVEGQRRFGELPGGTSPLQALQSTLEPLLRAGKTVYIADDVPNFSFSPRLCKYQSSGLRVHRCADEREFYDKQLRGYDGVLDRLAEKTPHVHVLKLSRYFCDASNCSMRPATKLLFRDSDHMSIAGSQYVGERIAADYPTLRAPPPP